MFPIYQARNLAIRRFLRVSNVSNQHLLPRAFSNVVPFKLADIGEGIAEVELMKWFVKVM